MTLSPEYEPLRACVHSRRRRQRTAVDGTAFRAALQLRHRFSPPVSEQTSWQARSIASAKTSELHRRHTCVAIHSPASHHRRLGRTTTCTSATASGWMVATPAVRLPLARNREPCTRRIDRIVTSLPTFRLAPSTPTSRLLSVFHFDSTALPNGDRPTWCSLTPPHTPTATRSRP